MASASSQSDVEVLIKPEPPPVAFSIKVFNSFTSPVLVDSQNISNKLSTGSVSYTAKYCIGGVIGSPKKFAAKPGTIAILVSASRDISPVTTKVVGVPVPIETIVVSSGTPTPETMLLATKVPLKFLYVIVVVGGVVAGATGAELTTITLAIT